MISQDSTEREKALRLAIYRIEKGRAHTKPTRLSIAAVAREAGVSTALIHNHYPHIAEDIQSAVGRSSRSQRDSKHQQLQAIRDQNRKLREEILRLELLVRNLASEIEVLISENRELQAIRTSASTPNMGKT
jgi:AcrR family transcriptional regulator